MRPLRLMRRGLVVVLALAFGACASSGEGGSEAAGYEGGDGVAFVVDNDVVPPAPVTVFLMPEDGNRRRLGIVQPNSRRTFNFRPAIRAMEYTLVADVDGAGRQSPTNPFDLNGVTRVEWSVSVQQVRVIR